MLAEIQSPGVLQPPLKLVFVVESMIARVPPDAPGAMIGVPSMVVRRVSANEVLAVPFVELPREMVIPPAFLMIGLTLHEMLVVV